MRKRRMDAMFMGEYNHSIDAKGRMIVPAKFREQLGNEFVVTKGLDGCLFVYSNEEWHRIEENLRDKPLTSREARKFIFCRSSHLRGGQAGQNPLTGELKRIRRYR